MSNANPTRLSAVPVDVAVKLDTLALIKAVEAEIAALDTVEQTMDEIKATNMALEARHIATNGRIPYDLVCMWRRKLWSQYIAQMLVADAFAEWVENMTTIHGRPTTKCWHQDLDWLTALMVVRYGEAVDFWPAALNDADLKRASDWMAGKLPNAVTGKPIARAVVG